MAQTNGKLLIVDDEPILLHSLAFTLRRYNYEVSTSAFGGDALRRLTTAAASGAPFNLLITDVQLPGMSGVELLRAACQRGLKTPALVITAHGSPELRSELAALGVDGYFDKPFCIDELAQRVKVALGQRGS